MEAIGMVTSEAARALRLDHEIGTIEPGSKQTLFCSPMTP